MTDPQGTLAIFAEVSIALAGFSGIVIAFGKRSAGSLSRLEIRRLSNLFTLSGMALITSLTGLSLLHIGLDDPSILWSLGSGVVLLLATPWLIRDMVIIYRLEAAEKAQVSPLLVVIFNTISVATLLLQFANCFFMREAWPLFLAIVLMITVAFEQFILLVRTGIRVRDAEGN